MGKVGSYLDKIKQVLVPGREPLGVPRVQIGNVKHPIFVFFLQKFSLVKNRHSSTGTP